MKRVLLLPVLAAGFLLWACDSTSPLTEPEVSADQTELMNFVHTPNWPDRNEDGYFCVEDNSEIIRGKLLPNGTTHWFYPACRDNRQTLVVCPIIGPCPHGPCPGNWDLASWQTENPRFYDPDNCMGGPPQG